MCFINRHWRLIHSQILEHKSQKIKTMMMMKYEVPTIPLQDAQAQTSADALVTSAVARRGADNLVTVVYSAGRSADPTPLRKLLLARSNE